jgi:glycosyltransferase involved in cell wall biosynthesis
VRAARWFGQHAWPLVRRAVPAAQWDIVGREPSRAVRRLARLPGVRVTGFVPDVVPYLCRARVVVNSTLDEIGVQTKLIEALAAGKPAVVTPQAAAGMAYDAPPPFLVSGSPCGFADAVVRLLRDDALAARLGARAREVAAASYDVDVEGARLEQWLIGDPAAPPKPARPDRQRASAPQRRRKPLAIGGAR